LGYRNDVEAVLASARSFCLASEWEGVPFAMMEALSAGLVPVVTDVGTINDWIRPGENGCLVPVGDASALARTWENLFAKDGSELARLRQTVLAERDRLGFMAGANVWRDIFSLPRST
jgi:glycosyltransferase involved in cell wall biosynthesis